MEQTSSDNVRLTASWDSPPRRGEPGYGAFEIAFRRLLDSRDVHVKNTREHLSGIDNRRLGEYRKVRSALH